MTTAPSSSTTSPPPDLTLVPCPEWCTRPAGHPLDALLAGRPARAHAEPAFGPLVSVEADEYADSPGQLRFWAPLFLDENTEDPAKPRDLAENLVKAAEWLEARR